MTTTDTADLEAELRRRLADVAAMTSVDDDALDEITARARERRPARRRVAAVAATLVLVAGAAALTWRESRSPVRTHDRRTTTTTTTTEPEPTTTTAPTPAVPPGVAGIPPAAGGPAGPGTGSPGSNPGAPAGGVGQQPASGAAPAPGAAAPPPPAAPGPVGTPPGSAPDGRLPVVTLTTADYDLQVTAWHDAASGVYSLNVWHPDLGLVGTWSWDEVPGMNCLGGTGTALAVEGAPTRTVYWGFVRSDAADVRVVLTSQVGSYARTGPEIAPGIRPWIGEKLPGTFSHVLARDAGGNVLHTATGSPLAAFPDTC